MRHNSSTTCAWPANRWDMCSTSVTRETCNGNGSSSPTFALHRRLRTRNTDQRESKKDQISGDEWRSAFPLGLLGLPVPALHRALHLGRPSSESAKIGGTLIFADPH